MDDRLRVFDVARVLRDSSQQAASGDHVGSSVELSHVPSRVAVLRGREDRPCTMVCDVGRGRIAFIAVVT